ncbi:hypothetical protein E4U60_002894 [Claviceps pazoutovae]|uniref:Uncharacterized protein n=1 Tax=Claviceps pazoutovae TaxID=1649127 RepID=A0A9P7MB01_9HYPO|nr:hypothetical protein E4U60_002894 [Claviceps pazoutovae]
MNPSQWIAYIPHMGAETKNRPHGGQADDQCLQLVTTSSHVPSLHPPVWLHSYCGRCSRGIVPNCPISTRFSFNKVMRKNRFVTTDNPEQKFTAITVIWRDQEVPGVDCSTKKNPATAILRRNREATSPIQSICPFFDSLAPSEIEEATLTSSISTSAFTPEKLPA